MWLTRILTQIRMALGVTTIALLCLTHGTACAQGTSEFAAGTPLAVTELMTDGIVNLRKAPDPSTAIVAKLPAKATGIVATGKTALFGATPWLEVEYGGTMGWLNARYVRRADASATKASTASIQSMEHRLDTELLGNGYAVSKADTFAVCERRCLSDARCQAMAYHRTHKTCGLFEQVPTTRTAQGIDTAIKRSGNEQPAISPQIAQPAPDLIVSTDPFGDCNSDDVVRQLSGCTAVIRQTDLTATDRAVALSRRADASLAAGRPEPAIADLLKSSELEPGHADTKRRLADAYRAQAELKLRTGDHGAAIQALTAATDLAPGDKDAQLRLSMVLDRRAIDHLLIGRFDRAIADYTQAIKLDPTQATFRLHRGIAYSRKNLKNETLADYDASIRLDPELIEAYIRRGDYHASYGAFSLALADYQQAFKRDPQNVSLLLRGALWREEQGNFYHAVDDYKAVLAIDPTNPIAKAGAARLEAHIQLLQRAEKLPPRLVEVQGSPPTPVPNVLP